MEQIKVAGSKGIEVLAREPDPTLTENAIRVLEKRYVRKDEKGRVIETPKEIFARVAWNLAQAERPDQLAFAQAPNGRPLAFEQRRQPGAGIELGIALFHLRRPYHDGRIAF